ncbi:MAG: TIR domain-containing protein [candidate division Zixibacteria bacterium]|nr:TIR domain-containing protein [candidate division Zixibacteria bacterium]
MNKPKGLNKQFDPLPDLPNYDPEPADGVRVGESPVPGLTLKRILRGHHKDVIRGISWSPSGEMLASGSDGGVHLWNITDGIHIRTFNIPEKVGAEELSWSPDSQKISSGCTENSAKIWEVENGKLIYELRSQKGWARHTAWSPDGQILATGSHEIYLWDPIGGRLKEKQPLDTNDSIDSNVFSLAWSPSSRMLAVGQFDGGVFLWNSKNASFDKIFVTKDTVKSITWTPNGDVIASGSGNIISVWDVKASRIIYVIEGHTSNVECLRFCPIAELLISKSQAGDICFWRSDDWKLVNILHEKSAGFNPQHGISFHPYLPRLATLGEKDTVIRIWDLDMDILLGQATTDSVNYTTAKVVLVGDSGVGKTGLGWRLAHKEYKEQDSTHGQQFWVIPELGKTRKDGTECEAVLWDLAGQHVYRQIHSIFLDKVDASLVLFDPGNRQNLLKGAEFWLEQLKGKDQLPPSILVGARVDRGAPVISKDDLKQFCQRYGISGGYHSTSAKSGEGIDELVKLLREQIPWDDMTTTVTTTTFKSIKDFVLSLKEEPDRENVLVRPSELREKLEAFDPEWQFTDAEMMTAVGHLQNHGYVTILQSSSGDEHILLVPDLLVDLASSIVLLADKHPRELGAVSETDLLHGRYPFEELEGLEKDEQQILLDAAVLRFMEHNICFRETFGSDTLLIFPGLIKQKRPLDDDFPATDDVSYVVRGRVENLYAMLVVLLGHTPSFSRINQWQNQARYEMGKSEICGFRLIEDREGEIELVLYYSDKMPDKGRETFQQLFETFLYQRDVEIKRIPPVICPEGHQLERATVINRIDDGKTFAFCAECGGKVNLPDLNKSGIGTDASVWLQREAAVTHLRSTYETYLTRIKSFRRGWATPRCYLSHVADQEPYAKQLTNDLKNAGVYVIEEVKDVKIGDHVIILDTSAYQNSWKHPTSAFKAEVKLINARMAKGNKRLISIVLEGKDGSADLHDLNGCEPGHFCDATHYPVCLFNMVLELYAIPLDHAAFVPYRMKLHEQWERTPMEEETAPEIRKRFDVALSFPGEKRKFVKTVADKLAKKLGRERVFYDNYHKAELIRPDLDIYLQEIYHNQAELIVVFLCAEYRQKQWCGLEWRAVRDLLKKNKNAQIMFVRFDDTEIPGTYSTDGYLDANEHKPTEAAKLILERLELNRLET